MKLKDARSIKKIPLHLIDLNNEGDLEDERATLEIQPKHEAIIESMKKDGYDPAHAMTVRFNKDTGRYDVVDGRQRLYCAQQAGLDEVLAVVTKVTGTDAMRKVLTSNTLRFEETPLSKARKMKRILDEDINITALDLAQDNGMEAQTVRNLLSLLENPRVAKAVEDGKIKATHGYLIAPLPKDNQNQALEACIENRMTVAELKNFIKTLGLNKRDHGNKTGGSGSSGETKEPSPRRSKDEIRKAKLAKFYGKLPTKAAEFFLAYDGLSEEQREIIRFCLFDGFKVGDEDKVPGLKEAQEAFLAEVLPND